MRRSRHSDPKTHQKPAFFNNEIVKNPEKTDTNFSNKEILNYRRCPWFAVLKR